MWYFYIHIILNPIQVACFLIMHSFFSSLLFRSGIVEDGGEVKVAGGEKGFKISLPDAVCEVKLPQMISLAEWSSPKVNDDGLHIRLCLKVDQFSGRLLMYYKCMQQTFNKMPK